MVEVQTKEISKYISTVNMRPNPLSRVTFRTSWTFGLILFEVVPSRDPTDDLIPSS